MALATKTLTLLILVLVILAAGCGKGGQGSQMDAKQSELIQIHEFYQAYVKKHKQPPQKLSDLNKKEYETIYPGAFRALMEGKYLVAWSASEPGPGAVLIYEKDAPTQGGVVLLGNGTVKTLSAADFPALAQSKK